jgi:hypothetical protein
VIPTRRGVLPLHAALSRPDAASTAAGICSELLGLGATPLAAAAAADGVQHASENAIDFAMRLRLWEAVALFISSGKAGSLIISNSSITGDEEREAAAQKPSAVAAQAKVAAAAAAIVENASAGRSSIVAELLLRANADVLSHQISASSIPITPIYCIMTMGADLHDNIANLSSNLLSAISKLTRTPDLPIYRKCVTFAQVVTLQLHSTAAKAC